MRATNRRRHLPGVRRFVERRLGKANCEGFNRARRAVPRRHCQDSARIDAATEENSERHIADQTAPNCLREKMIKLIDEVRLCRIQQALIRLDPESPVGDNTDRVVGKTKGEMMACWQFAASLIKRVRSRNVSIGEELLE